MGEMTRMYLKDAASARRRFSLQYKYPPAKDSPDTIISIRIPVFSGAPEALSGPNMPGLVWKDGQPRGQPAVFQHSCPPRDQTLPDTTGRHRTQPDRLSMGSTWVGLRRLKVMMTMIMSCFDGRRNCSVGGHHHPSKSSASSHSSAS